jgi:hypothetical protein
MPLRALRVRDACTVSAVVAPHIVQTAQRRLTRLGRGAAAAIGKQALPLLGCEQRAEPSFLWRLEDELKEPDQRQRQE